MTDAALKNAEATRDALATQINVAQQQIDAWRKELRRVEAFISDWHSFAAGEPVPDYDDFEHPPAPPPPSSEDEYGAKPKKVSGNSKKEEVAEAAREIIRERGEPVSRSDLYQSLVKRGLRIEGSDPEMVLSTMLWRMKDRVVRLKSGGYWLADVKNDEIGYDPKPPEAEAEFQVRVATEHPAMDASGKAPWD